MKCGICGKRTKAKGGICKPCQMPKVGRPIGSKTESITTEVIASTCPRCGSSKRSKYQTAARRSIRGKLPDGREFYLIIWRRCRCISCKQARIEKTYELSAVEIV